MANRNGYFKLNIREMGAFLRSFPPEDGGKRPEIKEILQYLERKGYSGFNLRELNDALICEGKEPREVYVGEGTGFQENEEMEIIVSGDKMLVFCRFYPPSDKGSLLSEEDIMKSFASNNIKEGIRQDEIKKFQIGRAHV